MRQCAHGLADHAFRSPISMGDACGIGPEIVARLFLRGGVGRAASSSATSP